MVTQTPSCVTGDFAFAVTRHGVISLWNPIAEEVVGYPASSAIGQHCWKILRGKDVYGNPYCSKHCKIRETAFNGEPVNTYQASFKTRTEGRKHFLINCLLVLGKSRDGLLLHICRPQRQDTWRRMADAHSHFKHKPELLTRREKEVLGCLKVGNSTSQIASTLSISTTTVRNHIQHILKKLKVHSRLEAIIAHKRQNDN